MKQRVARLLLAGSLALTGAVGFACDREDRQDVRSPLEGEGDVGDDEKGED